MSTGTLYWRFSMGTNIEPCWEIHQRRSSGLKPILVAYAKRAKDGGWFVRIGNMNPRKSDERIYIDEHVFPPAFMTTMLHMSHQSPEEEDDD